MSLTQQLLQLGAHWSVRPVQLIDMQASGGFVPRLQVELALTQDRVPAKVLLPLQASTWSVERLLTHALAMLAVQDTDVAREVRCAALVSTSAARSSDFETMTLQEVWEAAGGNPGMTPTREDVLETLRILDEVCDEAHEEDLRRRRQTAGTAESNQPSS